MTESARHSALPADDVPPAGRTVAAGGPSPVAPEAAPPEAGAHRVRSDLPFFIGMGVLGGVYVLLISMILAADVFFVRFGDFAEVWLSDEIRYATRLSIVTSCITTILALWVAVPIGYLMSRYQFRGKVLLDAVLDIPIVLPPLVIGVSLLILFQTPVGEAIDWVLVGLVGRLFDGLNAVLGTRLHAPGGFTYAIPGVILAQFMVAAAFAVRTLRTAFDEVPPRKEQVALTLGCTRFQAFWHVVLPEARGGVLAAATITWARAIGEFGPIMIFAGATPMRTEVMPTSIFLQMSLGNLRGAVAVSLLMVAMSIAVLVVVRSLAHRDLAGRRLASR